MNLNEFSWKFYASQVFPYTTIRLRSWRTLAGRCPIEIFTDEWCQLHFDGQQFEYLPEISYTNPGCLQLPIFESSWKVCARKCSLFERKNFNLKNLKFILMLQWCSQAKEEETYNICATAKFTHSSNNITGRHWLQFMHHIKYWTHVDSILASAKYTFPNWWIVSIPLNFTTLFFLRFLPLPEKMREVPDLV